MKLEEACAAWDVRSRVFVGTKAEIDTSSHTHWHPVADFATSEWEAKAKMMTCFHTLVLRYHLSPEAVHQAFLVIDEYRGLIDRTIEGSDDGDGDEGEEDET